MFYSNELTMNAEEVKQKFLEYAKEFLALETSEKIKVLKNECSSLMEIKEKYHWLQDGLKSVVEDFSNCKLIKKTVVRGTFTANVILNVEGMGSETYKSVSLDLHKKTYSDDYEVRPSTSYHSQKVVRNWLVPYKKDRYSFSFASDYNYIEFSEEVLNIGKDTIYLDSFHDRLKINDLIVETFANYDSEEVNFMNFQDFINKEFEKSFTLPSSNLYLNNRLVEYLCKDKVKGARLNHVETEIIGKDVMDRNGHIEIDNKIDVLFDNCYFAVCNGNNAKITLKIIVNKDNSVKFSIEDMKINNVISNSYTTDDYSYSRSSRIGVSSSAVRIISDVFLSIAYPLLFILVAIFEKELLKRDFTLKAIFEGFPLWINLIIPVGFWVSLVKRRYYGWVYVLVKVVAILYLIFELVILLNSFIGIF